MEKIEAPVSSEPTSFKLELPPPPRAPELLVELAGVTKSYGAKLVYRKLDLSLRRGDRIAFLGANGRGKSTLMKLLAGTTSHDAGTRRMSPGVVPAYFAQFQLEELNPNRTVLEELGSVAGDLTTGRLRSILGGFLFRGDDVFKKVSVLSGGEKSRLILAKIMLTGPNLLLLDEPSNHLDIPARDMLEQALTQFSGTICLISHDRRLINAVANKVLVIQDRRVEVLPGNFDDYQRLWRERVEADSAVGKRSAVKKNEVKGLTRAEREAKKREEAEVRRKMHQLKAPLERKIENMEARLEELTGRLDELSAILALPETYQDPDRSRSLNEEYGRVKAEIDKVTEEWEEAAMELEEIDGGG